MLHLEQLTEMPEQEYLLINMCIFNCRTTDCPALAACSKSSFATSELVKDFVMSAGICQVSVHLLYVSKYSVHCSGVEANALR